MSWTTPADIRAALERRWNRGDLLCPPEGAPLFPLPMRLSRPNSSELASRFDEVRQWIRALDEGSKARVGAGYEIVWSEVNHRQLGPNRLPTGLEVPTRDDALSLIGKRRAAARFGQLRDETRGSAPALLDWVDKHPLSVLEHAEDWARILAAVTWFSEHPRPGIYLRQVDIPGVDSKFIEAKRLLLSQLLDQVLPAEAVDRQRSPTRQFELRYGLLSKPALVRFRILDPDLAVGGLMDLSVPADDFARLELAVRTVFITENEINGLAFPPVPRSMVVFGLGYGLDRLTACDWLRDRSIVYWGDIDTHGFAMLDRLRAAFPAARSMLMDRKTLMAHRTSWVEEPDPHRLPVDRLTPEERALFESLRAGELGERVRLEQECVRYEWLMDALEPLGGNTDRIRFQSDLR
ncbi:MAG: hypothetical protein KA712_01150 [Myxococcales bacterium]|nr:hypothetical protein [Myxococcales bacterium]